MGTYDQIRDLPLEVDGYELSPLERDVSSDFHRLTTIVHLRGGGEEGVGEDVSYEEDDQLAFRRAGAAHDLSGSHTVHSFSELVGGLDLFPEPVRHEPSLLYRRWAFESAALDLALRQAGVSLADHLGRELRPLTFVVSLRMGKPPSIEPVRKRLDRYPTLRFKLDPTSEWTDDLIAELVDSGSVDSVDFKGLYKGTIVDQDADPDLYRRVSDAFPDAWIEDPELTPETDEVLRPHRDRITWDANIHSVADIESLPFPPKMVNLKPSRFGSLEALFAAYDYCAERRIGAYGGGQFELGAGRGQIQYLASLFHPDTPNDVAPGGYNDVDPVDGLPASPLAPQGSPVGFRWGD